MPGQLEEGVPENGLKLAQVHLRRAASMKVIRVSSGNSSNYVFLEDSIILKSLFL